MSFYCTQNVRKNHILHIFSGKHLSLKSQNPLQAQTYTPHSCNYIPFLLYGCLKGWIPFPLASVCYRKLTATARDVSHWNRIFVQLPCHLFLCRRALSSGLGDLFVCSKYMEHKKRVEEIESNLLRREIFTKPANGGTESAACCMDWYPGLWCYLTLVTLKNYTLKKKNYNHSKNVSSHVFIADHGCILILNK